MPCKKLIAGLSTAGAAVEDHLTHRRRGDGQAEPNGTLREFHADMVRMYGNVAPEGSEMFISNSDRETVSALKICQSAYRSAAGMWGVLNQLHDSAPKCADSTHSRVRFASRVASCVGPSDTPRQRTYCVAPCRPSVVL